MQTTKIKLIKRGLIIYTAVIALLFVLIQFGIFGANTPVSAWSYGTCSSTPAVEASFISVWGAGAEAHWKQEAADSGHCGGGQVCTPGEQKCRDGQYNDRCKADGSGYEAGGNACTGDADNGGNNNGNGGIFCPISYCNDNYAVPQDPNYTGGTCTARTASVCNNGHNGSQSTHTGTNPGNNGGNNGSNNGGSTTGKRVGDACNATSECSTGLTCDPCGSWTPNSYGKCVDARTSFSRDVGCAQPGANPQPAPASARCGDLLLGQIRCNDDGSSVGTICTPYGTSPVRADACGASCANGVIQQIEGRSCTARQDNDGNTFQVVTSTGFIGCGNQVQGGSQNKCDNCYLENGQVVCRRECSSCGARVDCAMNCGNIPPATNVAPTSVQENPQQPPSNPPSNNPQTLACGSQCTVGSGPACPSGQSCNPGTNTCALNTCIQNPASCAPNMCQPASQTAPNFTLDKFVDGPRTYTVGDLIRFGINITNTGNTTLTTMSFNDSYAPAYLDYVSITGVHVNGSSVNLSTVAVVNEAAGTIAIANLATHLGNLAPGQTYRLNINFIARAPVNQTINYASATSGPLTRTDNDWVQIISPDTDL